VRPCLSQNWTPQSAEPETIHWPSCEIATDITASLWPVKSCIHLLNCLPVSSGSIEAVLISQYLSVLSAEHDTKPLPSGVNATDQTQSSCPLRQSISVVVSGSQMFTTLLNVAATKRSSGETASPLSSRNRRRSEKPLIRVCSYSISALSYHPSAR